MLAVKFGAAPRICRACIIDRLGVPPGLTRAQFAEMSVECHDYPCEWIEEPPNRRKGC